MTEDTIRKRGLCQPQTRTENKIGVNVRKFTTMQSNSLDNDDVGGKSAPNSEDATMSPDTEIWYARWEQAIRAYQNQDPKANTLKAISLRANLAGTYMSNTLRKRTVPRVDDFLAVCDVIGVNPIYILQGETWTPEKARASKLFSQLDPVQREAFFRLWGEPKDD